LLMLAIMGPIAAASADGGLFRPKKYSYPLRISRSASYQLQAGDYVEVGVVNIRSGNRVRSTLAPKVQIVKISGAANNVVLLDLAMSKKEIVSIRQALLAPASSVALRIVQKQPRNAAEHVETDLLPDLNFEEGEDIARSVN
jgi:hypothetical protein